MIDAKVVRGNPDAMREVIRVRKVDPDKADVDRWLALDGARRELQQGIDALNGEKKELAKLGKSDPDAARQSGAAARPDVPLPASPAPRSAACRKSRGFPR